MGCLTTKEIQNELLSMLVAFDRIALEHGVRYSLDGGTLLGAVRHKGFIPWDDDIDVIVPRPDFDRLAAHPEWFSGELELCVPGQGDYLFPFIKLMNRRWRAQEPKLEGSIEEFLWVDVFPADSMPLNDNELADLMSLQRRANIRAARSCVNIEGSTTNPVKRILKSMLFPLHRVLFPAHRMYEELSERAKELPYGSTSVAGNVVWGPYMPDKPGFPAEDFDNLLDMEFEGRTFKACPHWDAYLNGFYGDYMQLPPEDQRVTHGMKVWRADEKEEMP